MQDFFEESLNFKYFLYFLIVGLLAGIIFIPFSFLFHSLGHGIFGALSGAKFIGIYLPLDKHSNAVLNYPSSYFSGTKESIFYWLGGHLFIFLIILFILILPTGVGITDMVLRNSASFYFAFLGGFLETVLAIGGEESSHLPEILKISPIFFIVSLSLFYLALSFFFIYKLISSFGKAFKESLIIPLFLGFSLFYLPCLAYLIFLFFYKDFIFYIHIPTYIASTVFLLSTPLIPRGKALWKRPTFWKNIYALGIFSLFSILLFFFLFYRKKFPFILWGKVGVFCNLPLEVNL